jgi:hypothetical protein
MSDLIIAAEHDRVKKVADVESLYDKLQCPKQMLTLHADRGAAMHCEMNNRSLLNRKVLDWLDESPGLPF